MLKINDKSHATNSITFSVIDPKRADKRTNRMIFEPFDNKGDMVTKSNASTVDW